MSANTLAKVLRSSPRFIMLGVGGAGMRGLAHLLVEEGRTIIGTDRDMEGVQSDTSLKGIEFMEEAAAVDRVSVDDVVIFSDAIEETHPVVARARSLGSLHIRLHDALGAYAVDKKIVAVAGTHGKSSTTALLGHILITAGLDPTVLIGAAVPSWKGHNARRGAGLLFIVEADEYRNHFLHFSPHGLLITNIEHDHPDYFAALADVVKSFKQLIAQTDPKGFVVTTQETHQNFPDLGWPATTQVVVVDPKVELVPSLLGQHMQANAQLAVAAAIKLGVKQEEATASLKTFAGLKRRLELLGKIGGASIYSDYGHHPTEITKTLQAVAHHWPDRKILVIFEPHTEERFVIFFDQFATALSQQKYDVAVYPIYRARKEARHSRDSQELVAALQERGVEAYHLPTMNDLPTVLKGRAPYDAIVVFSAGDADGALRRLMKGSKS